MLQRNLHCVHSEVVEMERNRGCWEREKVDKARSMKRAIECANQQFTKLRHLVGIAMTVRHSDAVISGDIITLARRNEPRRQSDSLRSLCIRYVYLISAPHQNHVVREYAPSHLVANTSNTPSRRCPK